jgi:glycosyltransferase involved in cell wall biosynthesis
LAEEKGVFLLPDVVAHLLELGYSDFTLDIIGGGMVDELARRISELRVEGHINLRGWMAQSELRRSFRESDVLVFPTAMDDPMPLTTLEASSEGCVPLIPLVSGVSEWLIEGVDCLKAERTPEGFAAVLKKVMDGDVDLGRLSRQAVRVVNENFAIESVMPVVEAELRLAADGRRPKTGNSEDLYRMALIGDALLRRYVVEETSRAAAFASDVEV